MTAEKKKQTYTVKIVTHAEPWVHDEKRAFGDIVGDVSEEQMATLVGNGHAVVTSEAPDAPAAKSADEPTPRQRRARAEKAAEPAKTEGGASGEGAGDAAGE